MVTPGGIGTYEEFFEIYTLRQLARHNKPIIIFNINGYYDKLLEVLEYTVKERFMQESCLQLYSVATTPEQVLVQLAATQDASQIEDNKYL